MNDSRINEYIDSHKDEFINDLKHWISIQSVSAYPACRANCRFMMQIVSHELRNLGCSVEVIENPVKHTELYDGKLIDLPPIILASFGSNDKYKTVCIYGYLDVQPAEISDGWKKDPFEMNVEDDLMIGRGTTANKGPTFGWVCLLKAYKELNITLNINLKFVFECMKESLSKGLAELVLLQKNNFLKDVDYVCISNFGWAGNQKPCLIYSLRGLINFSLEVSGPKKDLHSGSCGGTIREPMTDLIKILSRLVDFEGKLDIPRISDKVAVFTSKEKSEMESMNFEIRQYIKDIGCEGKMLTTPSKYYLLAKRSCFPSFSFHGVEGCYSQPGLKNIIPGKVIGKFSIHIVPGMQVEEIINIVKNHISNIIREFKIQNKVDIKAFGVSPMISNVEHPNFIAAKRAIKRIYHCEPDIIREGGSIPIAQFLQQITGKNIVVIPIGRPDDGAYSQNEKLNISNFINGIKIFSAYIDELSKL